MGIGRHLEALNKCVDKIRYSRGLSTLDRKPEGVSHGIFYLLLVVSSTGTVHIERVSSALELDFRSHFLCSAELLNMPTRLWLGLGSFYLFRLSPVGNCSARRGGTLHSTTSQMQSYSLSGEYITKTRYS